MTTHGLGLLLVLASAAFGQPPAGGGVSPEVHPDRRVTFRVNAPKAADVTLTADWLAGGTTEKLTKDARGVWSVTVGPLQPVEKPANPWFAGRVGLVDSVLRGLPSWHWAADRPSIRANCL
jgi:hypothetical protein